jgi:MYXO-CTERM domain-containing protein
MCCFSAKTEVHGTSIFGRFLKPGTQVLVYQMRYAAAQPTAMILPLPVALAAKEEAVRFRSLKEYASFFDVLATGFPAKPSFSLSRSKGTAASAAAPLAVHEVGDYVATFVPSRMDFTRVDPQFQIPTSVWDRIPAYADYGFAVFQLKELSGTPHPIAFEFETRTPGVLYYPTVHIHDGTLHEKDDFDHVLYAQEPSFDVRAGDYDGPDAVDAKTSFIRSKEKLGSFMEPGRALGLVAGDQLLHKTTLRGLLPNRDTSFDVRAVSAGASHGCSRCDATGGDADASAPTVPAAAALALGWIIRRRDERRRSR